MKIFPLTAFSRTFGSRSVVKQKGMVLGFRKTATVVTRPER